MNITAFVQCFYLKIQMLQIERIIANSSIFTHIHKKPPETDCRTNVLLLTPLWLTRWPISLFAVKFKVLHDVTQILFDLDDPGINTEQP